MKSLESESEKKLHSFHSSNPDLSVVSKQVGYGSKICRFDGGLCHRNSCEIFLGKGDFVVCVRHANPHGRLTRRKYR